MKTAISVPDDIFQAAEGMAKRLGMSRSQLYSTAVREYLETHRTRGVTALLNQVYDSYDSQLDLRAAEAQAESLPEDDW
jgi:metal-responsive CopG/Arc/MetJ family transcriptional regulator